MNSSNPLRTCVIVFLAVTALFALGCGGSTDPVPTGPSSIPEGQFPGPSSGPGALSVSISPNPVPWSSEPTPNCSLANNWHYQQTLTNVGGATITISDRTDFFDGVEVSRRSGLGIVLAAGASTAITTNWCSGNNVEHRAQTNFSGSDDNGTPIAFTGPTVRLRPR